MRRLHQDGRIYLTLQPRARHSIDGAIAGAEQIVGQMHAAGLGATRVELCRGVSPVAACVIGGRA